MASPEHVSVEAFEFFEKLDQQDTEAHARTACMVWITSGLYCYVTTAGVSLFSFSALAFFVIGTFVASIVMGRGGYFMRRTMAAVLVETVGFPGPKMAGAMQALGSLLLIAEIVMGYEFTRLSFDAFTAT